MDRVLPISKNHLPKNQIYSGVSFFTSCKCPCYTSTSNSNLIQFQVTVVRHDIALIHKRAAIDSLPDDILVEIFKLSVEPRDIDNYYDQKTPFQIVASHVTRRWRFVAIHVAALWSHIDIMHFQNLKLVETYLQRSQGHLLDIRFAIDLPPWKTENSNLTLSLAMLIPHVERWRLFTVNSCSYPTLKRIVVAIRELSAPNLVHFGVYLRANECPNNIPSLECPTIFAGGAPRLTYFECKSVSIGCCWPLLPLDSLTYLSLDIHDIFGGAGSGPPLRRSRFRELLENVPALTNLKLRGCIFTPENDSEVSPVELPYLVSLDIDFDRNGDYTRDALTVISAPALTTLTLFSMPSRMVDVFVDIIRKSKYPKYPVLTHLKFVGSYYPNLPGSLMLSRDFFDALPTITHFSIISCGQNTIFILRDLAELHRKPEAIPWPKLRTVMIRTYGARWVRPLCDLATVRIISGHPLESIELSKSDFENEMEFLRDNVRLDLI